MSMYGVKEPISADSFFEKMAEEIDVYDTDEVGFCFSYPMEILPNNDGRIMWLTKEVKHIGVNAKLTGNSIIK